MIQVPLVYEHRAMRMGGGLESFALSATREMAVSVDVDLGHSPIEGPFREIRGNTLVRDKRFPIRVTVQWYRGVKAGDRLNRADFQLIHDQIHRLDDDATFVGSLVTDGYQGRITEHPVQPRPWVRPPWWGPIFPLVIGSSTFTENAATAALRARYGDQWPLFFQDADSAREAITEAVSCSGQVTS